MMILRKCRANYEELTSLINTNRYTFVWRGALNYHLAGLLDRIDALYTKYNYLPV